jgi:xylulokinase
MGTYVHAGPTQAGGSALSWIASVVGVSLAEALALAAEAKRDPQPIVFLPHLQGERAPYWNPDARGVFLGMTASTEARHMILAALEGVGFAVRMVAELCETAAHMQVEAVRVCGGGARSALWNEIKASTLGRRVDVLETLDAGVLGAALIGMVAAGLGRSGGLEGLIDQHVRVASRVEPRLDARHRSDDLYGLYTESYRALEPVFPRLARSI